MNQNTIRVLSAVIAGIMIIAMLAACGEIEKNDQKYDQKNDEVVSDIQVSENIPDVTDLPDEDTESQTQIPDAIPSGDETSEEATNSEEPIDTPDITDEVEWMKTEKSQKIVDTSITMLGVPFKQGGDSPEEGFDSSGFIYYCVNQADMAFPRNLKDQLEAGERISYDELAAGDIVYFSADVGGNATFGGIYVGGGLMIYSPVPDDFVKTANITTNYWVTHFVTGIRPIDE